MSDQFYTLKGYEKKDGAHLSPAMEDYLEMICRYTSETQYVRVNFLAAKLNVTPPSASKMVTRLKEKGLVEFEPYGLIRPSKTGWQTGSYLLHRHDTLHAFFCLVNHSDNELDLIEKIEHFIDGRTVDNMERLLPVLAKMYTY